MKEQERQELIQKAEQEMGLGWHILEGCRKNEILRCIQKAVSEQSQKDKERIKELEGSIVKVVELFGMYTPSEKSNRILREVLETLNMETIEETLTKPK